MDGGEKCSLSLSPSSCAFPDDFRLKFMTFYDPRDHMEILNETHIVTIPALCRRPCVPFRSTARDKDKSWWPSLSTHNPETEKKKKTEQKQFESMFGVHAWILGYRVFLWNADKCLCRQRDGIAEESRPLVFDLYSTFTLTGRADWLSAGRKIPLISISVAHSKWAIKHNIIIIDIINCGSK